LFAGGSRPAFAAIVTSTTQAKVHLKGRTRFPTAVFPAFSCCQSISEGLKCCTGPCFPYFSDVLNLTRQEQRVLIVILGLLLVGWAVKYWRLGHPNVTAPLNPPELRTDATN